CTRVHYNYYDRGAPVEGYFDNW
nr:immunoglobulin heavy chain junction region [Macaca mulatta]MOV57711.1 immunoglobulin heavy chain junction region [Macaca mulatta]